MKLRIIYDKDLCIGNKACHAIDPKHFIEAEEKVNLKGAVEEKNIQVLEGNYYTEEAERFIEAAKACPVNAIGAINIETEEVVVTTKVKGEEARRVKANYDDAKEFVIDPAGYFLIRINKEGKKIEVAFCNEKNKIKLITYGKKPIDIYQTILNKEKVNIRKDHAAYLGRELQKAYIALKKDLEYVQDEEIILNK